MEFYKRQIAAYNILKVLLDDEISDEEAYAQMIKAVSELLCENMSQKEKSDYLKNSELFKTHFIGSDK